MTQVKFLIDQTVHGKEVFAYFPQMPFNDRFMTCYAHMGQHSACSLQYIKGKKEALYNEYSDLLRELIGQGHKDLQILNKQEIEAHRPPTAGEIKFGEGATHYLTVNLAHVLNKKGEIKKWFVWPGDGLRYYIS